MLMVSEILRGFVLFLFLGFIGIGPALSLISFRAKRVSWALGVAPTVGYMLIALLAFPLVRYLGPTRVWAQPVGIVLIIISLALLLADWRKHRENYSILHNKRNLIRHALFFVICYGVLIAPTAVQGMRYAVFRSNPSDAFVYSSLAESLRSVYWKDLWAGAELTSDNMEAVKHLGELSPTALFSARHLVRPLSLSGPATFAWSSSMFRVLPYRFQHVFYLVIFLMAGSMALVLADIMHASQLLRFLSAGVVILGFWAYFLLNTDSAYQITSIPLLMLLVFVWILVEENPRLWTRHRFWMGVTLGVTLWFYLPLAAVLGVSGIIYYGIGLLHREYTLSRPLYHGMTGLISLLTLFITGQIDFAYRNMLYLVKGARSEGRFPPKALATLQHNGLATLWGFPAKTLAQQVPDAFAAALWVGIKVLGVLLLLVLLITLFIVILRRAILAERLVGSFVLAGLGLMILLYMLHSLKPAGQAFTYTYAFFILFGICYITQTSNIVRKGRELIWLLVVFWLGGQMILGLTMPATDLMHVIIPAADARNRERYNIEEILSYLNKHHANGLLVSVPDTDFWGYNMYLQFAFAPYEPYFQNGILIDNTTKFRNVWLNNARSTYQYGVVAKGADYVGFEHMGRAVAESSGLILYKFSDYDARAIAVQESVLRQQEMDDPPFPSLVSSP